MSTISKVLLYFGLVVGGGYLIANFVIPSLSLVEVNGEFYKDTSYIIITSSFIFIPCFMFSLFFHVLSKNLSGVNSASRIDENLIISNQCIKYSYRIKHQSLDCERIVIIMDLMDIDEIEFDNVTHGLLFKGNFKTEYYEDYASSSPDSIDTTDNFLIYDYFKPSLKECLEKNNIKIIEL